MRAVAGWGRSAGGRAARVWAGALAIAFLAVGILNRDGEALVFGVLSVLAALLTRARKGTVGRVGLGLLAADTAGWMLPAAIVNARDGMSTGAVVAPIVLAVLSVGALALVVGMPPMPVLAGGLLLFVVAGVWSVVSGGSSGAGKSNTAASADIRLRARNAAFDRKIVEAPAGGDLAVRNDDLFWHTFTVPDLHINLRVATGATRRIALDVPAGSYRFVCAIPGHDQAGMNGTLIVR
jgi:plastocyanin